MNQLISGKSREMVTQSLVARGWPEVSARQFVINTAQAISKPQIQVDEDDEHQAIAEMFRRRITRDFLLTSGFMLGMLAANDLFPSAPVLTLFFLSMCTFSFVDLLIALIGWWRNR
jgi:hypothetical protein